MPHRGLCWPLIFWDWDNPAFSPIPSLSKQAAAAWQDAVAASGQEQRVPSFQC